MKLFVFVFILLFWLVLRSNVFITSTDEFIVNDDPPETFPLFVSADKNDRVTVTDQVSDPWIFQIPKDEYYFSAKNQTLLRRNACSDKKNGEYVLAKGRELYEYVTSFSLFPLVIQQQQQQYSNNNDDINYREHDVEEKRIYYFKCKDNEIDVLLHCPEGTFFDQQCTQVDLCANQNDGFRYPNLFEKRQYYECANGHSLLFNCPDKQEFVPATQECSYPANPCKYETKGTILLMSDTSFYICEETDDEDKLHICKRGTYATQDGLCLDERCRNQMPGTKIAMKHRYAKRLEYGEGYILCNTTSSDFHRCPLEWDSDFADVHLPFLPKVFYNRMDECMPPDLCQNVFPVFNDVIIQKRDWRLVFPYATSAEKKDSLAGYVCDRKRKRRKLYIPRRGNLIIHPDKIAEEDGCTAPDTKLPRIDSSYKYWNCLTQREEECPQNQYFNAEKEICAPTIATGHKYKDLTIFHFNNLTQDNWIPTADYVKQVTCDDPKQYVKPYNVCVVDPVCEKYLFVSQINRPIKINDTEECAFEDDKLFLRTYEKAEGQHLNFWKQRLQFEEASNECVYGQKISSGDFVLDSTIYATCDREPFVFCPSSDTKEIQQYSQGVHVCMPNDRVGLRERVTTTTFYVHELGKAGYVLVPKNADLTIQNLSSKTQQHVPPSALDEDIKYTMENFIKDWNCSANDKITLTGGEMTIQLRKFPTNQHWLYIKDGEIYHYNALGVYMHRLNGLSYSNAAVPKYYDFLEKLDDYVP